MHHNLQQLVGLLAVSMLMNNAEAAPIVRRSDGGSSGWSTHGPPTKRDPPLAVATVFETPLAASLYDTMATWKAPLVPGGSFRPMPLITTVPVPSSSSSSAANTTDTFAVANVSSTPAPAAPSASTNTTKALSDAMLVNHDVIKGLVDSMTLADDTMNGTTSASSVMPDPSKTNVPKPASSKQKRDLVNRRSTKHQWSGVLKRRAPLDDKTKDIYCPGDDRETLVPVTFQELYEIKTGKSKLITVYDGMNSTSNATASSSNNNNSNSTATAFNATLSAVQDPDCVNKLMSTVIVVPVSELQMAAIDDGTLIIKSSDQRGVVTLTTSAEMKASTAVKVPLDAAAAKPSNSQIDDVNGPSFAVVPIDYPSPTSSPQKLPVSNTISGPDAGTSSTAPLNATAPSANTSISLDASTSAAPSDDPTSNDMASIKRRSNDLLSPLIRDNSLIKRALEFERMQIRGVKPSSADNTSLIGNGKGKKKYNHTIHNNAAFSTFAVQHQSPSILAFFIVGSLYAWLCL